MTERILVVDDDAGVREALSEFLLSLGYVVVAVENGEEALAEYEKGDFDVVMADLIMPNMDGMELLRRIRGIKNNEVIFLMITGHPSISTAVEAINRGADDYITKPFHLEDVKLRISKALEKQTLKGRLKTAQGLAWGLMLSIPLWLLLGIILVILFKG
ncbi:MAG: response regulator [Nitrospirota bacterium]|nr:response regulator [Nitrospirota bacterium]MDX2420132.1 response regulator [Nitrospirota bacterium]